MSVSEIVAISSGRRAASDGALRRARVEAGLSQAELARALDVTPAAVSRWESGARRPRSTVARRLSAVLRALEAGGPQA